MDRYGDDSFLYASEQSVADLTIQDADDVLTDMSKDDHALDSDADLSVQSFGSMREWKRSRQHRPGVGRRANASSKPPPAKPPSFQGSTSFSTITASERDSAPSDITEVYKELQEINAKLKKEYDVLHERSRAVTEREKQLTAREDRLQQTIDADVRQQMSLREQGLQLDIERLENALREKVRENRRLQENFNTLKSANDVLRKEVDTLQTHHDRIEKQSNSLQARLVNLQRKQDHEDRRDTVGPETTKASKSSAKSAKVTRNKPQINGNEVMATLLEWVSDFHLRLAISDLPSKQPLCPSDFIQEKCLKIFPQLVEILKEVATQNSRFVLPCLQFMYWSLLHLDQGKGHQRSALSSTLRRLGEELYRPRLQKVSEDHDRPQEAFFFRSQEHTVRFLSALIILKTISQVDHLAQVFDFLRNELKSEAGKELFINYQATPVILFHLKPANKTLMNSAIDIYMQLSMESEYLAGFLETCSNEQWFRTTANVWKVNHADQKVLEKLSIILQKLSKIKSNRKYFEVFGITTSAQELVRTLNSDQEAAFLSLNLKSILFNLNANKPVVH